MKKIRLNYLISCLFILVSYAFYSQQDQNEYTVKFTSNKINIDGLDNESSWDSSHSIFTNWTFFPNVSDQFDSPTELKIVYDDTNIYILAKAFTKNNNFVIPSLRWDFPGRSSDCINLLFDTFSDGNNAYLFGSNMLGVKRDALISNGGYAGSGGRGDVFDISWDGKWEVEGKVYDGYYLIEY